MSGERGSNANGGEHDGTIGFGGWLLRATIGVLLIVGVISLVPSLRGALFGGAEHDADAAAEADTTGDSPAAMLPDPDTLRSDSLELRFDSFEFELTADQRNGTLRVRTADRETAAVEIRTRTRLEQFYRIPGGMRIINRTGSVADYEVVLPRGIRAVRLYMGGRIIADYLPTAPGNADRTFELVDFAR